MAVSRVSGSMASSSSMSPPELEGTLNAGALKHRPVAWVTPILPRRTGIANYSDLSLRERGRRVSVDVFSPTPPGATRCAPRVPGVRRLPISALGVEHSQRTYRDIVYQLGNNHFHTGVLEWATRLPGSAVLHEQTLWGAAAGFRNATILDAVARRCTRLIVHSKFARDRLQRALPGTRVEWLEHPEGVLGERPRRDSHDCLAIVCAGIAGPNKRIEHVIRGVASYRSRYGDASLTVAGQPISEQYARRLTDLAQAEGLHGRFRITGWLSPARFDLELRTAHVLVNLRTPGAGEQSGQVPRAIMSGVPMVLTDSDQFREVPLWAAKRVSVDAEPDELAIAIRSAMLAHPRAPSWEQNASMRSMRRRLSAGRAAESSLRELPSRTASRRLVVALALDSSDPLDDVWSIARDLAPAFDVRAWGDREPRSSEFWPTGHAGGWTSFEPAGSPRALLCGERRVPEAIQSGLPVIARVTRYPLRLGAEELARCSAVLATDRAVAHAVRVVAPSTPVWTWPRTVDQLAVIEYGLAAAAQVRFSRDCLLFGAPTDAQALDRVRGWVADEFVPSTRFDRSRLGVEVRIESSRTLARPSNAEVAAESHLDWATYWGRIASTRAVVAVGRRPASSSFLRECAALGVPVLNESSFGHGAALVEAIHRAGSAADRWSDRDRILRRSFDSRARGRMAAFVKAAGIDRAAR